MPTPTSSIAQLQTFRAQLHACFFRRADALFELGDALLCAEAVPSLPHLSLEPVHQRGWGSVYAAVARGDVDAERLRDLLARVLPAADPPVFAVDVTHLAALRRRMLARARLLLPSLAPFGRPADHRRLGLAVDLPAQL